MRNILVHDQAKPFAYPAVPAEWMVQQLEAIVTQLAEPQRVIPLFQRRVQVVAPDDSIATVLQIVAQHDYSQFPVYNHDRFRGLLTENGITRWLAQYSQTETMIDFADARVRHTLKQEESQDDCLFVDRQTYVDDVAAKFISMPNLEAVIITQHGRRNEKPMGIVTRWNVAQLGGSHQNL